MSEYKRVDLSAENLRKFWDGPSNIFVRSTIYLSRGLGRFNEMSKYLQLVLASYWTGKYIVFLGYTINPNWILIASVLGVPILMAIGRWDLFKAQKATEFISIQHGTVIGYNGYNISIETLDKLKEILDEMKKK